MENSRPIISVDIFVYKNNQILLGKRKDNFTKNSTFAPPGGHLENGETLRNCALREVKEETGLIVKLEDVVTIHENNTYGKHYVIICFRAKWIRGKPKVLEPEKCYFWEWYSLSNLPEPLFANNLIAIKNLRKKIFADKRKSLGVSQ